MYNYHNPKDKVLIPHDISDFIAEDAPVRLVNEIVDNLDLSKIERTYAEAFRGGKPGYAPKTLLKVILFGYMNNSYSTREIEAQCKQNVNYLWLTSCEVPDHTTIHRFKTKCIGNIKDIFAQLVMALAKRGEIALSEDLYIDGTTIRSRAARRKISWRRTAERLSVMADDKLQKAIAELMNQVDQPNESEQISEGRTSYSTEEAREIAKEIEQNANLCNKKGVRTKLREIKEACDRKDKHNKTLDQCHGRCGVAPKDPDCGIFHAKEDGYEQHPTPNYNVQAATQKQYVTNYEVYDTPNDKDTALDFVDKCIAENQVKPKAVVEDAGYGYEEVYVGLEKRGIEAVVKYPKYDAQCVKRPNGKYHKDGFKLTPDGEGLICPAGHTMTKVRVEEAYTTTRFRSDITHFSCSHSSECPFKEQCNVTKNANHTIERKLGVLREEDKAKRRLDTPQNQERLRRRSLEPEPVFGNLKSNHGYNRFRHFGKAKVRMDLGLMFMALNLRKLYKNTTKVA
jgi:transposase